MHQFSCRMNISNMAFREPSPLFYQLFKFPGLPYSFQVPICYVKYSPMATYGQIPFLFLLFFFVIMTMVCKTLPRLIHRIHAKGPLHLHLINLGSLPCGHEPKELVALNGNRTLDLMLPKALRPSDSPLSQSMGLCPNTILRHIFLDKALHN